MKKREGCLKVSFIVAMIILVIIALLIYIPLYSSVIKAWAKPSSDWQTMNCDIVHFKPDDTGVIYRCYDAEKDNYCYIVDIPFNGISCVPGH